MMKTSGTAVVIAGAMAAQALFAPVAAAQSFNMKIAHLLPPGDPRDLGAHAVADFVMADERCDISAQVFPSGQLGSFTEINEGVQFGSIEMSVQPAAYMAPIEMKSAIIDFPFFWPTDIDELLALHKGPAAQMLAETFEPHGIKMLDIWHTGFMQWTSNEPLTTPEAFQSKIARVMPSSLMTERQRLFGLNPVTMPFSETYSALQTGALAAQENPIPTSYNMRFHEVQEYMTMTFHGTLDQFVSVNMVWWNGLTDGCRDAIIEGVAIGNAVTLESTMEQEESARAEMEASGMTFVELTDEERAAMRDIVFPGIRDWWLAQTGDEGQALLDAFMAEMN
ncbi:C4-dicarboxylate-binding protein DctP [Roseinatronobacter thiooxidans]|uniref:C4-dicarboxylate-binding protein DctP n=1 Tax=Roseinatronobacter thiooxidans TaxID=121821 RepID=A0A2W7PKF8_9RHOB|nr:TRAP transporter substrate-binding protein [Roseinatronobacter thiooxidans]PZX36758.1 C4-dicarboxylate-binding protein DctP [Roseinatronobacter thiooxidans]